jgi:predicted PurR-regulated permease PerM
MRNAMKQGYRFRIGDMAITDRIKRKPKAKAAPTDFGTQGHPLDRSNPFYFGFVATLGALLAIILMRALASTSQIFVLIIVALFLATGLNPAVEAIQRRGMSRTNAVAIIFISVIVFVIFFIAVVIPPVVSQGTQLINSGPTLLAELKNNSTIADLNSQFGFIDTLQTKLKEITADGTLIISAFGGVIGVGKSVLSGTSVSYTHLRAHETHH